ncbi:Uncharacterised protein [Serratia fonticola]|uniref:Uncharacterized protein n=1 Tax=Serratia fonticola TaxID=47917 RepID=A0A4U9WFP5_SERFO|nr:Uncharacterised protein [Serratia fonticola]
MFGHGLAKGVQTFKPGIHGANWLTEEQDRLKPLL